MDWIEEFNKEFQQHTGPNRRKNQWAWKQVIWNYPVRRAKSKKNERKKSVQDLWDTIQKDKISKNFLNLGRFQFPKSKFMKLIGHLIISIQNELLQYIL